ncbi:MAG: zf-HC2 domain-containing protein [Planctomycetaceae bacterium]|nr:zf-HC2 domain-containing protein [Planctomycetaceae bacterium]
MNIFSCKHAATAINESLDGRLSLRKRMVVRLHLMMCSQCRRFKRQMLFLRRATQKLTRLPEQESQTQIGLSTETKIRLQKMLQNRDDPS